MADVAEGNPAATEWLQKISRREDCQRGWLVLSGRMNRRDFLVNSSLLVSAGLVARAQSAAPAASAPKAPPPPTVTEFRPLRRGVGLFTARGGTMGYLANKDVLAAVDTQFADTAALFLAGLPGRGDRMLDVVINTHHHGDHTGGNAVLKPSTKTIVAHANVPKLQFAAAEKANTLA